MTRRIKRIADGSSRSISIHWGGKSPAPHQVSVLPSTGKSIRYKTNHKARVAAADQPRKRRRWKPLLGDQNPLNRFQEICKHVNG